MINDFRGSYWFLSNFYPSPITFEGINYPTVEHAYQAAKTSDKGSRYYIASLLKPGDAKRAGRNVNLRPDWENIKVDVMKWCLAEKFSTGSELTQLLIATDDEELVEGNTWGDHFWGVCNGVGENWLGRLLMDRRAWLRSPTIYYAGIGSRQTPDHICLLMEEIARKFASLGVVLRSGGAEGADKAFERGAGSRAETYYSGQYMQEPYELEQFRGEISTPPRRFLGSPPGHYEIAERYHPAWGSCSSYARALHARNVSQILGLHPGESEISSSVVCWTLDGSLDGSSRTAGGTGQALRIAAAYGVHVVNLQRPSHHETVERWLHGEMVAW